MRRSHVASLALCALAVSTTSCVIVDPSCSGGGGASILVTPSVVVVAVGQSMTPRASWCRSGRYDRLTPSWSLAQTADGSVIALDPSTGTITGRRAGSASVIATYEGAEGSRVDVTVR